MRKLELVKFTVSFAGLQKQKTPNSKFVVEIDNVRIKDEDDSLVYHTLVSKYGRDYYGSPNKKIKNLMRLVS